ncbi:MAG: helix-turn-helix domain-containing protein [Ktedonobacteraceae bacterium]
MLRLRVKEAAEAKGWSMTKLSQRTEVSYNTIKTLFHDPYRHVDTDIVVRVAKALGVPALSLFEDLPDDASARSSENILIKMNQPHFLKKVVSGMGENKAMSENDELLTAEDVARIMKVHIRTVRQWVNDGKLDVIRIGAHDYRIMRADLDKFIEERRERRTPKNRPPIDV